MWVGMGEMNLEALAVIQPKQTEEQEGSQTGQGQGDQGRWSGWVLKRPQGVGGSTTQRTGGGGVLIKGAAAQMMSCFLNAGP